ncbi:MAG: isochorismate synthase [Chloroflexota bacterium]
MRITQPDQLNGTLISYAAPCPSIPLVEFLRRAHGERRVHWENAREPLAFAGYGAVVDLIASGDDRVRAMDMLARRLFNSAHLTGNTEPLLVGGFAFRPDFQPQVVWHGMAAAQFVLPEVMLRRDGEQTHLILSRYVVDQIETELETLHRDFETIFDDLFWNFSGEHWNPEWEEASDVEYPMTYDDWSRMITNATGQMKSGALDKVVLSRMCQIRFSNPVNIVRALEYLADAYPDTHRFLFEPEPHNAFYGATPETLVRVSGREVFADSLAGTVKRGATTDEDAAFAKQILNDPKERREHQLVVDGLQEHLAPFVDDISVDDAPGVLKLSNVQHLHTPVNGVLNDDYGVLPLVEALHPTPALGGQPRDVAEDLISTLEPITRGWYAAPIGWIDSRADGHFGVGIRAAVSRKGTVWCYAGGGIVAESTPQREWNETDLKFRPMLNAVGVANATASA